MPGVAELDQQILGLIRGEESLDSVAACTHRWQYEHCADYRQLSDRRGVGAVITGWRELPAVSVDAFRFLDLRCFPANDTVATFRTSGTTSAEHGLHHFDDLSLYKEACLRAFAQSLLPDQDQMLLVSLVAGHEAQPDSSLSQMVSWVMQAYGTPNSRIDPSGATLNEISEPVLLLGTAFGLANLLERQPGLRLPTGSRIMETGGFKGRRRELSREALHHLYGRAGVPGSHVIGEYGMTELSSQWYDGRVGEADTAARVYRPPPWARTRVLCPNRLEDVEEGEVGLLLHVDPVNRGSVQAVLTGDLGERRAGGFVFRGRASTSVLRGCSLRDES